VVFNATTAGTPTDSSDPFPTGNSYNCQINDNGSDYALCTLNGTPNGAVPQLGAFIKAGDNNSRTLKLRYVVRTQDSGTPFQWYGYQTVFGDPKGAQGSINPSFVVIAGKQDTAP
jgi:hypothetical protein